MSAFDIESSVVKAEKRLRNHLRKTRSDKGSRRTDRRVVCCVERVLGGAERPPMGRMLEAVAAACRAKGLRPPSRSTVYQIMAVARGRVYRVADLSESVQAALYNLELGSVVPGRQVAFYCFNYGDLAAMSFAAGLPWLALYQAIRLPGYRRKSRGLIEAVVRVRGIEDGRA